MAFINVSLADFEAQFNVPSKRDPSKRAFELVQPAKSEIYYECVLRQTNMGQLVVRVYTSVAAESQSARGNGQDAIRIVNVWIDNNGWQKPIGEKQKRVNRSGGATSTAYSVVFRAMERAREAAKEAMDFPVCNKCGRIKVPRVSKFGEFFGCIGFQKEGCK